jgi:hypothetical protein
VQFQPVLHRWLVFFEVFGWEKHFLWQLKRIASWLGGNELFTRLSNGFKTMGAIKTLEGVVMLFDEGAIDMLVEDIALREWRFGFVGIFHFLLIKVIKLA